MLLLAYWSIILFRESLVLSTQAVLVLIMLFLCSFSAGRYDDSGGLLCVLSWVGLELSMNNDCC